MHLYILFFIYTFIHSFVYDINSLKISGSSLADDPRTSGVVIVFSCTAAAFLVLRARVQTGKLNQGHPRLPTSDAAAWEGCPCQRWQVI